MPGRPPKGARRARHEESNRRSVKFQDESPAPKREDKSRTAALLSTPSRTYIYSKTPKKLEGNGVVLQDFNFNQVITGSVPKKNLRLDPNLPLSEQIHPSMLKYVHSVDPDGPQNILFPQIMGTVETHLSPLPTPPKFQKLSHEGDRIYLLGPKKKQYRRGDESDLSSQSDWRESDSKSDEDTSESGMSSGTRTTTDDDDKRKTTMKVGRVRSKPQSHRKRGHGKQSTRSNISSKRAPKTTKAPSSRQMAADPASSAATLKGPSTEPEKSVKPSESKPSPVEVVGFSELPTTQQPEVLVVLRNTGEEASDGNIPSDFRVFITKLVEVGLEVSPDMSSSDLLFCKIGATDKRLAEEAEYLVSLELDLVKVNEYLDSIGNPLSLRVKEELKVRDTLGPVPESLVWRNAFSTFTGLSDPNLPFYRRYDCPSRLQSMFTSATRVKLIHNIVKPIIASLGAHTDVTELALSEQVYSGNEWRWRMCAWSMVAHTFRPPIDWMKNYFGEQIAMQFAFLGFYNRFLLLPMTFGCLLFIAQYTIPELTVAVQLSYGFLLSLWGLITLRVWRHEEARLRIRWGIEMQPLQLTPRHKSKLEVNPVDGTVERRSSLKFSRVMRQMFTNVVVAGFSGVAVFTMYSIFAWLSPVASPYIPAELQCWVLGVLLALCAFILDVIGSSTIETLIDWEANISQSDQDKAMFYKVSIFRFFNVFGVFLYVIAQDFLPNAVKHDGCSSQDRLTGLEILVVSVVGAITVCEGIYGFCKSAFSSKGKKMPRKNEENISTLAVEREALKKRHSDLAWGGKLPIEHGFVLLGSLFPLAALLVLVRRALAARSHYLKLNSTYRRPFPVVTHDIGALYHVMFATNLFSVFFNSLVLLVYYLVPEDTDTQLFVSSSVDLNSQPLLLLFLLEHTLVVIYFALRYFLETFFDSQLIATRQALIARFLKRK